MKLALVILGAPGSGKGTQSRLLSQWLGIPQISTGDMLRDEMKRGTPIGTRIAGIMRSGKLVSDALVNGLVAIRVHADDCEPGFILDGYPRTVAQAEFLSQELRADDRLSVIEIAADPEHVLSRLLGRLMCRNCTAIYHVESRPPKKEGICDNCGAALIHRPDDVRDKIEERFSHYRQKTDPVIAYYKNGGFYSQVDGCPPPEQVIDQVMDVIQRAALETSGVLGPRG